MNKRRNEYVNLKYYSKSFRYFAIGILVIALAVGFSIYEYNAKNQAERMLTNSFSQSFYEASTHTHNISSILEKLYVTSKPEQKILMFAELYKNATAAQTNLGRLPYSPVSINTSMKFLSQVGDFSYQMLNKSSRGEELTDEDSKILVSLTKFSKTLDDEFKNIGQDLDDGNSIDWNAVQKYGNENLKEASSTNIYGSMTEVQKQFQEYPSLLYDGPFSDHIENMKPLYLKDLKMISEEEAKEIAINLFPNENITKAVLSKEINTDEDYTIPIYRFTLLKDNEEEEDSTIKVDITKQGGKVLWMLNYKENKTQIEKVTLEKAKTIAESYLKKIGFDNMEVNYFEKSNGNAVFNFASVYNDIIMYSDLVKVKVSLDDGDIVGLETLGYIMMHRNRNLPEMKISEDKAKTFVNKDFKISHIKKALIPLESKKEILCYELLGTSNNSEFLVYINAENGYQEKVMKVLRGEDGIFTE